MSLILCNDRRKMAALDTFPFLDYKDIISRTFMFNVLRKYDLPLLDPGRKT